MNERDDREATASEVRIQRVLEQIEWDEFFNELIGQVDRVIEQCNRKDGYDA